MFATERPLRVPSCGDLWRWTRGCTLHCFSSLLPHFLLVLDGVVPLGSPASDHVGPLLVPTSPLAGSRRDRGRDPPWSYPSARGWTLAIPRRPSPRPLRPRQRRPTRVPVSSVDACPPCAVVAAGRSCTVDLRPVHGSCCSKRSRCRPGHQVHVLLRSTLLPSLPRSSCTG